MSHLRFIGILFVLSSINGFAGEQPDLYTLSQSGFIMGPGDQGNPIHSAWKNEVEFMKSVKALDSVVDKIHETMCSADQNRSILLVGSPGQLFRYVYARSAGKKLKDGCALWHVEVDTDKIEAGHEYVGQVQQYWAKSVLAPSDNKDVILYFSSLDHLVGLGTHEHDSTGIEEEYVSNMRNGRMKSIAFLDNYKYADMLHSKNAYVPMAFAQTIVLPELTTAQVSELIQAYMAIVAPQYTLPQKEAQYLFQSVGYYMPNRLEPERTFAVLNSLIHGKAVPPSLTKTFAEVFETKHPYEKNTKLEFTISHEGVSELQIAFEKFETKMFRDVLKVTNADTGEELGDFSGEKGAFLTPFYKAKKLKLTFESDDTDGKWGFKIPSVNGKVPNHYIITFEDVRRAVMETAQVPGWMIDRDFKVVANLKGNLDSEVVGVAEGKRDLVRLAKNGYVAGRTDEKPIATILFTGPTGTGKSFIAKSFANFMGLRLITFDMTAYKDASRVVEFNQILSRNLINNPYAVFLFEEIDKASIEILDQLYFMMDEGIFYDQHQRPLFARGAFIVMTTNSASDVIIKEKDNPKLRQLVNEDLQKHFRLSFLNRFDAIPIFLPFTQEEFRQLAVVMLDKKVKRIKELFDWKLAIDKASVDFIALKGQSDIFGARPMERLIENVVGTGIAEFQIQKHPIEREASIEISKLPADLKFKVVVNKSESLEYEVDASQNLAALRRFPELMKVFKELREYDH